MVVNIAFIAVFFIEMFISYIFFNNLYERKFSTFITLLIGTILFEIGAIVNICFISSILLNAILSFGAHFVFTIFCFKSNKLKGAFYSILLVALSSLLEIASIFSLSTVTQLYVHDYQNQSTFLVIEVTTSKIIYFWIAVFLLKFIQSENTPVKIPKSFYFYPIATLSSIICCWYISISDALSYKNQMIISFISIILFISTIFVFFTFQNNVRRENQLIILQQEQDRIQTDISYYDILEKQNTNLRLYAHDAKNHLAAIKSLNVDPEINTYVSKMIQNLEEYSNVSHSGNRILDVIIDKYVTECNINNIEFFFDVKNNNLTGLEYHDIVSILGNLLDNAIEATLKSEEKHISFETDYRNNYSVIVISNSCDIPPIFNNSKTPITTKSNKALHGFGLQSVKKTIKKYDGDISIEYDAYKKMFIVTIMLDLKS